MAAIFHPTTGHWLKRQHDNTCLHVHKMLLCIRDQECFAVRPRDVLLRLIREVPGSRTECCWTKWKDSLLWDCPISVQDMPGKVHACLCLPYEHAGSHLSFGLGKPGLQCKHTMQLVHTCEGERLILPHLNPHSFRHCTISWTEPPKAQNPQNKEKKIIIITVVVSILFSKKNASDSKQVQSLGGEGRGKEICLGKYIVEVLHEPHGTTRDRTVLHKVSATTRMTLGPALSPASWRSCNLQLPLLSFQNFSHSDHMGHHLSATTISELVLPQASVCKLSTTGIALEDLSHQSSVCKHCSQILGTGMQAITTSSSPTGAPAGCSQAHVVAMPRQANPNTCSSSSLKMSF